MPRGVGRRSFTGGHEARSRHLPSGAITNCRSGRSKWQGEIREILPPFSPPIRRKSLVPKVGLEPTPPLQGPDFESGASAIPPLRQAWLSNISSRKYFWLFDSLDLLIHVHAVFIGSIRAARIDLIMYAAPVQGVFARDAVKNCYPHTGVEAVADVGRVVSELTPRIAHRNPGSARLAL